MVSREEFASYYTTVSALIPNEDYFELMIRNAWHISGGEGAAANSANLRVLVTHSDGEQIVVEIKNDLGLDPKDKKAVVARLRAQGVDVVAIPGYSDPKGAAIHAAQMAQKAAAAASKASAAASAAASTRAFPTTLRNQVAAAAAASSGQPERDSMPQKIPLSKEAEEMLPYVTKLRDQLKTRGASGFVGIQRCFRLMDEDSSGQLDFAEFKRAMKTANVLLTEKQVRGGLGSPYTLYTYIYILYLPHFFFYTLTILTTNCALHLPHSPSPSPLPSPLPSLRPRKCSSISTQTSLAPSA